MMYTCNHCKKNNDIDTLPQVSGWGEVIWVLFSASATILIPLYIAISAEGFFDWESILVLYGGSSILMLIFFWSLPQFVQKLIVQSTRCPRCNKRGWTRLEKTFHSNDSIR